MAKGDRELSIIIGADVRKLRAGLKDATGAIAAALGQVGVDAEAMARIVSTTLTSPHKLLIAGAAKAIDVTIGAIKRTQEYYDQLGELSSAMGLSLEDTAAMQTAARDADVEWSEFQKLIARISTDLASGGDKLARLGVSAADAAGNARPLNAVVRDVLDAMHTLKPGTEQAAGASLLLGRNWLEARNILNMSSQSIDNAVVEVRQLGIANENTAAAADQFEKAQIRISRVLDALQLTLGSELLPYIADLAEELATIARENGPQMRVAIFDLIEGLKIVGGVVDVAASGFRTLGRVFQASGLEAAGLKQILSGDVAIGLETLKQGGVELAEGFGELPKAAMRAADGIGKAWDAIQLGPQAALVPLVQPEGQKLGKSKEQLAQEERDRKEREREAKRRRDQAKRDAEDLQRIEIDLRESVLTSSRQAIEREVAIDQARFDRKADLVRAQLDLVGATADQRLQAEAELERQSYELVQRAAEAKALGLDRDSAEYAQHLADLAALEQAHEARSASLRAAHAQSEIADYRATLTMIGGMAEQMFAGMVQGTGTFAQRVETVLRNLTYNIAAKLFAALVEKVIAASVMEVAVTKAAALSQISAQAAVAGAGAAASQAAIPVIGPGLALGAMATTSAAVLGSMSALAVAAKGFDVGNEEPLTQLHKREMVLPAELAEKVRSMSSGQKEISIHVSAIDGASVQRVVSSPDFARALRGAIKDGRL